MFRALNCAFIFREFALINPTSSIVDIAAHWLAISASEGTVKKYLTAIIAA